MERDQIEIDEMVEQLNNQLESTNNPQNRDQLEAKIAVLKNDKTVDDFEEEDSMVICAAADAEEWLDGDDDMDLEINP